MVRLAMRGFEEIGFQLGDAVQIESAAAENRIQAHIGALGAMDRRHRIKPVQMRLDGAQFLLAHEVGLVEHDLVGKRDLLQRLAAVGEPHLDVPGVHHGGDRIERGLGSQIPVDEEGLRHGAGIGKARRLHHDGVEISAFGEKAMQRADQIAPHRAADAAIVHLEQLFVGVQDQLVVDADLAELVDDDGVAPAVIFREDTVQQRRFPAPR